MKHSEAVLYPNDKVSQRVLDYSASKTTTLPAPLLEYHRGVAENEERSMYMISTFQANAMNWISRVAGAKRVLEIGVYLGFSALSWSHCVGPEGSVTGLEFSREYAATARKACKELGAENVEIIEGDALETLAKLNPSEPYDIIFIDANKSGYPTYLQTILSRSLPDSTTTRLLRPGGIIMADNVLRRALVADDSTENPYAPTDDKAEYWRDTDIEKLREYNDMVKDEARLDAWLVPLWDGVGCARLVD